MKSKLTKVKALGLCSGGLDSILAALVLKDQGIHVEWITFETPFFSSDKAREASRSTGIPLTVSPITETYLKMLKNPRVGYGKCMNPCMDCHALMFSLAGKVMEERGFDFLFSGEVLGQRPMSQTKSSLRYVEKHSGYDGLILRPLSAQSMPETIPEKEGLVDRSRLLNLTGRSRKPQIELARSYNVTDYPAPAGGCLLTDIGFSKRLKDLFTHKEKETESDLYLLKHGRHLRLDEETKIIVGRTKSDNENIMKRYDPKEQIILKVKGYPGPIVIASGDISEKALELAAGIAVSYSKGPENESIPVRVMSKMGERVLNATGMSKESIAGFMI